MTCRTISVSMALVGWWALSAGVAGCKRRPAAGPAPIDGAAATAAAAPAPAADARTLPPGYDPAELVRGGADPLKVYLDEPRHPTWAAMVEEVIGGQLRRDLSKLVPEARSLGMGCRTLSCLILIDAPADKLEAAHAVVALVTLGPITVNLGPTPEGRGQLLFVTEPRMADPAVFTDWYKRTRRRTLDTIREGKQPNPLPVPAADLPTD